jgi:hypothetical protein
VIVRVVVVFPDVGILVESGLSVNVTTHVDVSENVLKFGVVVERNRSEGVEVIGVNFLSLAHSVPLEFLGSSGRVFVVRHDNLVDEKSNKRVGHKVSTIAHASEGR